MGVKTGSPFAFDFGENRQLFFLVLATDIGVGRLSLDNQSLPSCQQEIQSWLFDKLLF